MSWSFLPTTRCYKNSLETEQRLADLYYPSPVPQLCGAIIFHPTPSHHTIACQPPGTFHLEKPVNHMLTANQSLPTHQGFNHFGHPKPNDV